MFSRRRRVLGFGLALSDMVVMAIAFELAYILRQHLSAQLRLFFLHRGVMVGLMASSLAVWWLVGVGLGIYRRNGLFGPARVTGDTIRQAVVSTAIMMGWLYLLKMDVSRLFIGFFILINTGLLLVYRLSAYSLRRYRKQELHYFVIVGTGEKAVEVASLIEANEALGNRVLAFVRESARAPENAAPSLETSALRHSYEIRELQELTHILREHVIDEIIFAVSRQGLEQMEEIFLACEEEGVKVRVLVNFFPHVNSDIYLEKLHALPLLTFSATPEDEYQLFVKRVFDVALGVAALVLTAPLTLVIGLLVKLTSRGPVIYSQLRCGLNGRRFRLYKFRSMYNDAEARRAEVEHLNEMDGPVFKSANDPRVTPLGRLLRKFSLDELPQLFNIVKGDMSFVGPRPPLPEEVERYERWQRRRLRMKPGITCLWALEGRNKLDFLSWMRLDLDYIDHWSLLLDLKILLRTIPHVLSGKGL